MIIALGGNSLGANVFLGPHSDLCDVECCDFACVSPQCHILTPKIAFIEAAIIDVDSAGGVFCRVRRVSHQEFGRLDSILAAVFAVDYDDRADVEDGFEVDGNTWVCFIF